MLQKTKDIISLTDLKFESSQIASPKKIEWYAEDSSPRKTRDVRSFGVVTGHIWKTGFNGLELLVTKDRQQAKSFHSLPSYALKNIFEFLAPDEPDDNHDRTIAIWERVDYTEPFSRGKKCIVM